MASEANARPAALRLPGPIANILLDMVSPADVMALSTVCRLWHQFTNKWAAAVQHFEAFSEDYEHIPFLINFVIPKSAQSLRSLSIKMCIYNSEMSALASALAHCTNLQTLEMSGRCLETAGFSVLVSILPQLPDLMSLKIARDGPATPFSSLAPALLHCSKLEVFEANLAMYGSEESLMEWLTHAKNLNHLSIRQLFGTPFMSEIFERRMCRVLAKRRMRHLEVNVQSASNLARALSASEDTLEVLIVAADEDPLSHGVGAIIQRCHQLRELSLSCISENTPCFLTPFRSDSLTKLTLRLTDTPDHAPSPLSGFLPFLPSLEFLSVSHNPLIRDVDAQAISDAMGHMPKLRVLDLRCLSLLGASVIAESGLHLHELRVRSAVYRFSHLPHGYDAFCALVNCTSLRTLDLPNFTLTEREDSDIMCRTLSRIAKLQTLRLGEIHADSLPLIGQDLRDLEDIEIVKMCFQPDSDCADTFSHVFGSLPALRVLTITELCHASDEQIAVMFDAMCQLKFLRQLSCQSGYAFAGICVASALARLLSALPRLERWDISLAPGTSQDAEDILLKGLGGCLSSPCMRFLSVHKWKPVMQNAWLRFSSLRELLLSEPPYPLVFAELPTSLVKLDIYGGSLSHDGMRMLANRLPSLASLCSLTLRDKLDDESVMILFEGLAACKSWRSRISLHIDVSLVTARGAAFIRDTLPKCRTLTWCVFKMGEDRLDSPQRVAQWLASIASAPDVNSRCVVL